MRGGVEAGRTDVAAYALVLRVVSIRIMCYWELALTLTRLLAAGAGIFYSARCATW